jgi:ABC-type branched-subunit amino acid transport system ATPase component/branched-subunit amino acid ABC-type transport system permease component
VNEAIDLGVLGLGTGAIYSLLAVGLTVVYRGSGVLNFAQGAFAMASAYMLYQLRASTGWSFPVCIVLVVVMAAIAGALVQLVIMNRMHRSSPLARVVVTLGLLVVLESIESIKYGDSVLALSNFLPFGVWHITNGIVLPWSSLVTLLVSAGVAAVLWGLYRLTKFGLATSAVAENPQVAASLGHSPNFVATVNWAIGCGLAGLGGCLIAPVTGLDVTNLSDLVLPAIAAAVVASFRSFPIALGAGLLIGVVQAEVSLYVSATGWSDAVPFFLIMLLLILRGTNLPLRDNVLQRLPAVTPARIKTRHVLLGLAVLLVVANFTGTRWQQGELTTVLAAIVALSVVVVTGYAGQISLVNYGLAGVGALAASQLAVHQHVSLVPALLFGTVVTVAVGVVIALPAIRTRGVNLAIVTLGFGIFIFEVVLSNFKYAGANLQLFVGAPTLFGWPIGSPEHINRYTSLVAVVFVGVAVLVLNLRRGVTGRRLIAVRGNERAAASVGVSVPVMKLAAFGVSAFIAAIGGILFAFQTANPSFQSGYDDFSSISLVTLVVLGGVGFVSGATFAGCAVVGGILSAVFIKWNWFQEYLPLWGGLLVIMQLIIFPDGLMPGHFHLRMFRVTIPAQIAALKARFRPGAAVAPTAAPRAEKSTPSRVAPIALEVRGLKVHFGGVMAVDDVSLDVNPGEILGLIGPNGAGKTTVIDAITGFVRSSGSIVFGGERLDHFSVQRRAAHGLARSFQSVELFDDLSVAENIAVACEPWHVGSLFRDSVVPRTLALSQAALQAVEDFGLGPYLDRKPGELSFAQRRLIGIARSVARAPSILLLDEPGAGLDAREVVELGVLIRALASEWGMGVVLVEHHLDVVVSTCDRIVVLAQGRVISQGAAEDVMNDDDVQIAYTGSRSGA